MHGALKLFAGLEAGDLDRLLGTGERRRVAEGEVLVAEGRRPEAVWVLLEGVFALGMAALGDRELATLGPGEMVGEMSFLSGEPASAIVWAREPGLALAVPRERLEAAIAADPAFAARLYRAFALLAHHRLRERVGLLLGAKARGVGAGDEGEAAWREIEAALDAFKDLLARADEEIRAGRDEAEPATRERVLAQFGALGLVLNRRIGDASPLPPSLREELGSRVQREFLPYLQLTENAERYYSKPRGYAGDYWTIERMYENRPAGTGRLGPLIDACFLEAPSARAVRNRRSLLCKEILDEVERHPDRPAFVTSLACGPAREVFDAYERLEDRSRLRATLVDIDYEALAFVADRRDRSRLRKHVRLEQSNLVYLALGRETLPLPPQDLVYSIGLIDYFEDQFVVQLLDHVHRLLAPGGRVIVGNFHPGSPVKGIMDHILDWRLVHRSEADLDRLFEASGFGRACSRVRTEDEGINLFAECVKEPGEEADA